MRNLFAPVRAGLVFLLFLMIMSACHQNEVVTPVIADPRYAGLPADVVDFMKRVDATDARPFTGLFSPSEKISFAESVKRLKSVKGENAGIPLRMDASGGDGDMRFSGSQLITGSQTNSGGYADDPITRTYTFTGWSGAYYGRVDVDVSLDLATGRVFGATVRTNITWPYVSGTQIGNWVQSAGPPPNIYRSASGVVIITFNSTGVYGAPGVEPGQGIRWGFEGYLQLGGGGGGGNDNIGDVHVASCRMKPWQN
jgi:hypothetical protein